MHNDILRASGQVIFCDALNQMLIFPFVPFLVRDQLSMAADDPQVPLFAGLLAAVYLVSAARSHLLMSSLHAPGAPQSHLVLRHAHDSRRVLQLGQFACSPFYGGLSERFGRRPVLLTCVSVSTIFLMGFGFSRSYWLSAP